MSLHKEQPSMSQFSQNWHSLHNVCMTPTSEFMKLNGIAADIRLQTDVIST